MKTLKQIWIHLRVLAKAKRNKSDLLRWLGRRPQVLAGVAVYETALLLSSRVDPHLKRLATSKAAAMVNCEFCMDIGAEISRMDGLSERQIRELPRYRDSDAYSEPQKLVIAFAEAMSTTPAIVPEELREQLLRHLTKAQVAELAAEIAWEHQRARLNQALGVRPAGFSDGAACLLPEPQAAAPRAGVQVPRD